MSEASIGNQILLCIPARGGSKRLPRKNLALLSGKPMLAYTIEAAIASELADDVFVCTEDDEISSVAEQYGAKVFRIPQAMAEDDISSTVPCLALYDALTNNGLDVKYVFNLQPTSPLRNSQDIRDAFDILNNSGADYLVSATPIDPHYFHWAIVEKQNVWEMYFGTEFQKERIYLPSVSRPNGAIKLARGRQIRETGYYFNHPLTVSIMPEERSIHVGTQFDLICARAILENQY